MKSKIKWTWKRILSVILGILGIGTLTSCYGTPDDYYGYDRDDDYHSNYHDIYGTVSGKIDGQKKPIKNIVVSLSKKNSGDSDSSATYSSPSLDYTSSEGIFHFYDNSDGIYELCFTDIDGEKNGSFKQQKKEIELHKKDFALSIDLESSEKDAE